MKVKAETAFPFCGWWKGPSSAGSAAPGLWIEPRPGVSQRCYTSPGHSPSPPRCLRAPMPQPSVGEQQTVTGRRGRAPVPRCRRRGTPPPPQGDAWPRRVPGGGGCCGAVPVGFLCRCAAEGLSQPLFFFLFLSPTLLVRPTFLLKDPKLFFFFTFPPPPCKSHAVERRGGGGGRNPSPSPPPQLLPRKRNTWGVSSPPLPFPSRRSAPWSRSRRRGARAPRGRGGPGGQPRRLR